MAKEYIIIPGTNRKVYEGTVVQLNRLPNLKWILHNGPYYYNGRRQKGWYFSAIPSDTTMPVFNEDLVDMVILDDPVGPCPPIPPGPCPPGPFPPGPFPPGPGPHPPVPVPIPFTPQDKKQLDEAMLTVDDMTARDRLGSPYLQDGKIVRVNDTDGHGKIEYYSWDATSQTWQEASLGYRYMTREEITEAIGSDIVDIAWSNDEGALVLTDNNSTHRQTKLVGLAHDLTYTEEELTLRVPIYGQPDLVMKIPADKHIVAIRFEKEHVFPDGSIKPAIVVTVSDGVVTEDIAGDASGLYNIYEGAETATAVVTISTATSKVTADVKLSSIANNAIGVDNEGLFVDLSGYTKKKQIDQGFLLVADGNGEFTYAGSGIEIDTTTAIADLTDPERKVVTANLIADAITAAIQALEMTLDGKIAALETRVDELEDKVDFGHGTDGDILMTEGDTIRRTNSKIGSSVLSPVSDNLIATEDAVKDALAWQSF